MFTSCFWSTWIQVCVTYVFSSPVIEVLHQFWCFSLRVSSINPLFPVPSPPCSGFSGRRTQQNDRTWRNDASHQQGGIHGPHERGSILATTARVPGDPLLSPRQLAPGIFWRACPHSKTCTLWRRCAKMCGSWGGAQLSLWLVALDSGPLYVPLLEAPQTSLPAYLCIKTHTDKTFTLFMYINLTYLEVI